MSDTVFVPMFHPSLGNVQVQAPLLAVPTYQSHGWLLVDPNTTPAPVAQPFLTQAAGDSRYLRAWLGGETLTAGAVRLTADGHIIVRTADGTTRSSYDGTEAALWTVVSGGSGGTVTDAAMATAYGPSTGAKVAADPLLKAAYVPALPSAGSYTYNADGTIASDPDGNAYTWNADGTPATQTKGGVTRTFHWNADGTLASVS